MAQIREYAPTVSATENPLPDPRVPSGANVAEGIQNLGGAIGDVAESIDKVQKAEQQQTQESEIADVRVKLAQTRAAQTIALQKASTTATPGDMTFADTFTAAAANDVSKLSDGITTKAAMREYQIGAAELQGDLGAKAFEMQAHLAGVKAVTDYQALHDANTNTVNTDPSQWQKVRDSEQAALNDPNGPYARMPPDKRMELAVSSRQDLALAAGQGYIRDNPAAALTQLHSSPHAGQYDEARAQATVQALIPGARITSGYRTPEQNAAIGGAPDSYHTKGTGQALDFVPPKGMPLEEARDVLAQKLRQMGQPITELKIERAGDPHSTGNHIHWAWGSAPIPQKSSGDKGNLTGWASELGIDKTQVLINSAQAAQQHTVAMQEHALVVEREQHDRDQRDTAHSYTRAIAAGDGQGAVKAFQALDPEKKVQALDFSKRWDELGAGDEIAHPSDPNVVQQIRNRIYADPGDTSRIKDPAEIWKMMGHGLSRAQTQMFVTEYGRVDKQGAAYASGKRNFFSGVQRDVFKSSIFGMRNPQGDQQYNAWYEGALGKWDVMERGGKTYGEITKALMEDAHHNAPDQNAALQSILHGIDPTQPAPKAAPTASPWTEGQIYRNPKGERARYLGGGKWQSVQ